MFEERGQFFEPTLMYDGIVTESDRHSAVKEGQEKLQAE
jgi:hypothetical protein